MAEDLREVFSLWIRCNFNVFQYCPTSGNFLKSQSCSSSLLSLTGLVLSIYSLSPSRRLLGNHDAVFCPSFQAAISSLLLCPAYTSWSVVWTLSLLLLFRKIPVSSRARLALVSRWKLTQWNGTLNQVVVPLLSLYFPWLGFPHFNNFRPLFSTSKVHPCLSFNSNIELGRKYLNNPAFLLPPSANSVNLKVKLFPCGAYHGCGPRGELGTSALLRLTHHCCFDLEQHPHTVQRGSGQCSAMFLFCSQDSCTHTLQLYSPPLHSKETPFFSLELLH